MALLTLGGNLISCVSRPRLLFLPTLYSKPICRCRSTMHATSSSSTRHRPRTFTNKNHKQEPSADDIRAPQGRPFRQNKWQKGSEPRASKANNLKKCLSALKYRRNCNLLILGETGVGKSTFINAFINYLTHSTLDEAVNEKLITLIPNSFVITDENLQTVTVSNGKKTKDEDFTAGQSATQLTKVYKLTFHNTAIRIIDTPGIGDVRGALQDKKNFDDVLGTIACLKELHGIIILLKPNAARLTVTFRYCLDELLTRLHRSAKKNIIFGFTNGRSTNFRPGDTMPALLEHLDKIRAGVECTKDKVYCFDSEGYRFLAAHAHGISFDDELFDSYRKSWLYSVKETQRLLTSIAQLRPHVTNLTLSLNNARRLILQLTAPMAEIAKNISLNIKVLQEERTRMKSLMEDDKNLRRDLMMDKIIFRRKALVYPRTVCTNSACVKVTCTNGQTKVNYVTSCHPSCTEVNVKMKTTNNSALIRCLAMGGTHRCFRCGHLYGEHMHINYELEEIKVKVMNQSIKKLVDANNVRKQFKWATLDRLQKTVDQLKEEHRLIAQSAAQIGCFLRRNAITAYSNARLDYLDFLIKEEKNKKTESRDQNLLAALEDSLRTHSEELRVIKQSIRAGKQSEPVQFEEIENVIAQLVDLGHSGYVLHDAKRSELESSDSCYREETYELINSKRNSGARNNISPAQGATQKRLKQSGGDSSKIHPQNNPKIQLPKFDTKKNDSCCRRSQSDEVDQPRVLVKQEEGEKVQDYILRCLLSLEPGLSEQDRVHNIINGLRPKFLQAAYSQDFERVFALKRHLIAAEYDALSEE